MLPQIVTNVNIFSLRLPTSVPITPTGDVVRIPFYMEDGECPTTRPADIALISHSVFNDFTIPVVTLSISISGNLTDVTGNKRGGSLQLEARIACEQGYDTFSFFTAMNDVYDLIMSKTTDYFHASFGRREHWQRAGLDADKRTMRNEQELLDNFFGQHTRLTMPNDKMECSFHLINEAALKSPPVLLVNLKSGEIKFDGDVILMQRYMLERPETQKKILDCAHAVVLDTADGIKQQLNALADVHTVDEPFDTTYIPPYPVYNGVVAPERNWYDPAICGEDAIKCFYDTFLSNMQAVDLYYNDIKFRSSENIYQALKFDPRLYEHIAALSPIQSKRYVRANADKMLSAANSPRFRLDAMLIAVREKFKNAEMREMLLQTGHACLIEGNRHRDTFWGVNLDTGIGRNMLGLVLMHVRNEIREQEGN